MEKVEPAQNGNKKVDVSHLESDIIRQLEYYFSDSNLYRDKFLKEQIGKDDGWVDVTTLLTFKRLQTLSEDPKIIVEAIEKSDEGLVQVNEDKTKLRRHPERPLPEQNEEVRKEIVTRTAFVKGFPQDTDMDTLIKFFDDHNKVVNIVMRKYHDKTEKVYKFKGSVFATFATKDQADEFLKKEKLEFKDAVLIRKWQEQFVEEKRTERANKKKNATPEEKTEDPIVLPKCAVLQLKGFDPETTREDIRSNMETYLGDHSIAFIEYDKGQTSGYIRFAEENVAKEIFEKITDGTISINGKNINVRTLDEEEEEEYLKEQVNNIRTRRKQLNDRQKSRHHGGKRYNQQRGNNKRKAADNVNEDHQAKKK